MYCLDRAMQLHPGVELADVPRTCADATVIAIDALTALRESQSAHAELIRCVREHQDASREAPR